MYFTLTIVFLVLLIFGFVFEKVLEILNASYYSKPIPEIFQSYFSEENKTKNEQYKRAKFKYAMVDSSLGFVITFLFWFLGGFGLLSEWVESVSSYEIINTLLFFGILFLTSNLISLPFSYYFNFVLEEKFGFNKMSIRTFILDQVKSLMLISIIGGGLVALIVWVYESVPDSFWWIIWLILSIFMVFMTAFYAHLIVPLFNKQSKLEEGDLKTAIEKMALQLDFNLQNIFVMDGSKRSSKANAYFTGLGKQKRIVLYDTLINDLDTEEIIAVLAHEVGHYKHKHTLSNILIGLLQTGLMLYILSLFIAPESQMSLWLNQVLAQNQFLHESHFYLGIIGFTILYTPISMILGVLMNILSRRFEYQADTFAKKHQLGEPLKTALIKLSKNSLSNVNPHPLYVFVNYSHPTVLDRYTLLSNKS